MTLYFVRLVICVNVILRLRFRLLWTAILATGRVPKDLKMGEHFPVRESRGILTKLQKSGNFNQNTGKVWKIRLQNSKYWEKQECLFILTDLSVVVLTMGYLWLILYLAICRKNTGKREKSERSGNFVSPKKWEP